MNHSTRLFNTSGVLALTAWLLIAGVTHVLHGQTNKTINGIVYDSPIHSPIAGVKVIAEGAGKEVTTGLLREYVIDAGRGGNLVLSHPTYEEEKVMPLLNKQITRRAK